MHLRMDLLRKINNFIKRAQARKRGKEVPLGPIEKHLDVNIEIVLRNK